MIDPITLARPYARAAFNYAKDSGELDAWQKLLAELAAISHEPKISVLLVDPSRTARQRAELLCYVIGEDASKGVANLLLLMADNNRLSLMSELSLLFNQLKQQVDSTINVEVTSALPLSDEEAARLNKAMTVYLGRSVSLQSKTEPSLLGGAIIRADDLLIDGSVRGRLDKLAGALNQ